MRQTAHPESVFAFADTLPLAAAVAERLGTTAHPIEIHRFPDGESLVRLERAAPDRALILRSLDHPNEKLLEVLFAADALRRQGVREIGLVAPYLGYMRQDRIFRTGEPISQRVVAQLLDAAFDHVLTVEAHLHRIRRLSEIFECPAQSVGAAVPVAEWLRGATRADLIVGPDAESEPWIRTIADHAQLDWRLGTKTRHSDHDVRIELPALPPGTRNAWVIDDISSSGGTLEAITRILKQRGVKHVGAVVVHALFEGGTQARLERAGLDRLVSSDSIAHETNEITLAALLAETLIKRAADSEVS